MGKKRSILVLLTFSYCVTAMELDTEYSKKDQELIPLETFGGDQSVLKVVEKIESTKLALRQERCDGCCRNDIHREYAEELKNLYLKQRALEGNKKNVDSFKTCDIPAFGAAELSFASKKLESLHGFRGMQRFILENITSIDISDNDLPYLPLQTFLESCKHLENLNASRNKIALVTYQADRENAQYGIATNSYLASLNLSHNKLTYYDLAKQWTATPALQYLDLSHNKDLVTCNDPSVCWSKKTIQEWPCIDLRDTGLVQDDIDTLKKWYKKNVVQNMTDPSRMHIYSIISAFFGAAGAWIAVNVYNSPIEVIIPSEIVSTAAGAALGEGVERFLVKPCVRRIWEEEIAQLADAGIVYGDNSVSKKETEEKDDEIL
jgi:hypothetical protein